MELYPCNYLGIMKFILKISPRERNRLKKNQRWEGRREGRSRGCGKDSRQVHNEGLQHDGAQRRLSHVFLHDIRGRPGRFQILRHSEEMRGKSDGNLLDGDRSRFCFWNAKDCEGLNQHLFSPFSLPHSLFRVLPASFWMKERMYFASTKWLLGNFLTIFAISATSPSEFSKQLIISV